jgi:hypothetical protein
MNPLTNALQAEYTTLRARGLKARAALDSMIEWRVTVVGQCTNRTVPVPMGVTLLVGELSAEAERLRFTRRMVRP